MLDGQEQDTSVAAGAKAAEDRAVALERAPQQCDLGWTQQYKHVPCTKLPCFCLGTIYYEMDRQMGASGEQLLNHSAASQIYVLLEHWAC